MDPIILSIITSSISALISALVASLIARGKATSSRQRATEEGIRALLKAELYDIWIDYPAAGEPVPLYVRELASSCYRVYHDELGGNGAGEAMYREIMSADIRED